MNDKAFAKKLFGNFILPSVPNKELYTFFLEELEQSYVNEFGTNQLNQTNVNALLDSYLTYRSYVEELVANTQSGALDKNTIFDLVESHSSYQFYSVLLQFDVSEKIKRKMLMMLGPDMTLKEKQDIIIRITLDSKDQELTLQSGFAKAFLIGASEEAINIISSFVYQETTSSDQDAAVAKYEYQDQMLLNLLKEHSDYQCTKYTTNDDYELTQEYYCNIYKYPVYHLLEADVNLYEFLTLLSSYREDDFYGSPSKLIDPVCTAMMLEPETRIGKQCYGDIIEAILYNISDYQYTEKVAAYIFEHLALFTNDKMTEMQTKSLNIFKKNQKYLKDYKVLKIAIYNIIEYKLLSKKELENLALRILIADKFRSKFSKFLDVFRKPGCKRSLKA